MNLSRVSRILAYALVLVCIAGCDTAGEALDNTYGISPANEADMLNRALRLQRGVLREGDMPQANGTLRITSFPNAVEVSAGVLLYLPYSTNANNSICKIYLQVKGANSHWEAEVVKDSITNSPLIPILIPNFVQDGDFELIFSIDDCQGNISSIVTTNTIVSPPGQCGASISGSVGVTIRIFDLGDRAGTVQAFYEMYSIRDRMDLRYNGRWVGSTGTLLASTQGPNCGLADGFVSGDGVLTFAYNPAQSRTLEVYVTGCDSGTAWDVTVQCPQ